MDRGSAVLTIANEQACLQCKVELPIARVILGQWLEAERPINTDDQRGQEIISLVGRQIACPARNGCGVKAQDEPHLGVRLPVPLGTNPPDMRLGNARSFGAVPNEVSAPTATRQGAKQRVGCRGDLRCVQPEPRLQRHLDHIPQPQSSDAIQQSCISPERLIGQEPMTAQGLARHHILHHRQGEFVFGLEGHVRRDATRRPPLGKGGVIDPCLRQIESSIKQRGTVGAGIRAPAYTPLWNLPPQTGRCARRPNWQPSPVACPPRVPNAGRWPCWRTRW